MLRALIFAQDTGSLHKKNDSGISNHKYLTRKDSLYLDSIKKVQESIFGKNFLNKDSVKNSPVRKDSVRKILVTDSARKDSVRALSVKTNIPDSLTDTVKHDSVHAIQTPQKKSVQKNPVHLMQGTERNFNDRDIVFYILLFLLFFLGLIKTSFPKYVNSIFTLSFQATFRQTQTKEKMSQNFFPAFMLNVLFVLCGGLFITLFAESNGWSKLEFWQLFIYSTVILLSIYFVKYVVISFTGWVFNAKEAAIEYRFVVFIINKLLGILVLPLLFLISYSDDKVKSISITIVICLAIFSLAIRYLVSLSRIRRNLSITAFHFFIYLCAVEIMPLLVIYKLLFLQTSNR
ncbi:MAG: DUF4271 domain-containing protein [Parafilimonas sp.]